MKNLIIMAALVASGQAMAWSSAGAAAAAKGYMDAQNGRTSTRSDTVTAVLVGQEAGVSVTGIAVMRCIYAFGGARFARVFKDGCPPTVEVQ